MIIDPKPMIITPRPTPIYKKLEKEKNLEKRLKEDLKDEIILLGYGEASAMFSVYKTEPIIKIQVIDDSNANIPPKIIHINYPTKAQNCRFRDPYHYLFEIGDTTYLIIREHK